MPATRDSFYKKYLFAPPRMVQIFPVMIFINYTNINFYLPMARSVKNKRDSVSYPFYANLYKKIYTVSCRTSKEALLFVSMRSS